MTTVSLQASNRIWLTYRHFPYKAWTAIAELVDNSSQSYLSNRKALDKAMTKTEDRFAVRIHFDRGKLLSIHDNGMGMDLDDLRRAVQLAAPPPDTSGRSEFGMGMKTASCWLGDEWTIVTKKLGSETEYSVTIDVEAIAASEGNEINVTEKKAGKDEHYTRIEITKLHHRMPGRTLGAVKKHLVGMFRYDIDKGDMLLEWDGEPLVPEGVEPLVTHEEHGATEWLQDVSFEVGPHQVSGWICILADRGRSKAGFDLYRRGRIILGRPMGYRPSGIFGEQRNDLINQRLYGQLHLDSFPVNHLKDDFLWDGLEDELDEKLTIICADYVSFAKNYRSTKDKGVPETVVNAVDDEVADEMQEESMLQTLTIAEVGHDAPPTDPAVVGAKAEQLRNQQKEERIVTVGEYTFRIYHPKEMPATDQYFFRQSSDPKLIDIFVNDNHQYVGAITDESDYHMYVRMCVVDAITEHFLARHPGEINELLPAKIKDHILRGFQV